MYKRILIATDGSELADKAVTQGLELAKGLDATVTVVTVTDPWPAAEVSVQARDANFFLFDQGDEPEKF